MDEKEPGGVAIALWRSRCNLILLPDVMLARTPHAAHTRHTRRTHAVNNLTPNLAIATAIRWFRVLRFATFVASCRCWRS